MTQSLFVISRCGLSQSLYIVWRCLTQFAQGLLRIFVDHHSWSTNALLDHGIMPTMDLTASAHGIIWCLHLCHLSRRSSRTSGRLKNDYNFYMPDALTDGIVDRWIDRASLRFSWCVLYMHPGYFGTTGTATMTWVSPNVTVYIYIYVQECLF